MDFERYLLKALGGADDGLLSLRVEPLEDGSGHYVYVDPLGDKEVFMLKGNELVPFGFFDPAERPKAFSPDESPLQTS